MALLSHAVGREGGRAGDEGNCLRLRTLPLPQERRPCEVGLEKVGDFKERSHYPWGEGRERREGGEAGGGVASGSLAGPSGKPTGAPRFAAQAARKERRPAGSIPRGRGARDTCGHGHWVASHSGSRGGFKEAGDRQREILSGAAGLCVGAGGRPSGGGVKGGGRAQDAASTVLSPTALNVNSKGRNKSTEEVEVHLCCQTSEWSLLVSGPSSPSCKQPHSLPGHSLFV